MEILNEIDLKLFLISWTLSTFLENIQEDHGLKKDFIKRICKGISLARFVVLLAVSSSFEGCLRREDTFQSQVWKEWTSRFSAEDFEIVTKLWLLVAWPPQRKGKQNVFRGNPEKERCPEWQLLWLHWDWFSKLAKARDVWFFLVNQMWAMLSGFWGQGAYL